MPIVVRCERCGQRYQVGDQLAGRSLACKACGATIGVPAAGADGGLDPLDLGGSGDPALGNLLGPGPAAPSPYAARPAQPASPYAQPASPYAQPGAPYGQPAPARHQTNGPLGYQYPAPAPINSPYLNGPAPLAQPPGFDLPGLPAATLAPVPRKKEEGSGLVPYVVGAVVVGVAMLVAAGFLLFGGSKAGDRDLAGLGVPNQNPANPTTVPSSAERGPLGVPNHVPATPRTTTAPRPAGAGDLAAPPRIPTVAPPSTTRTPVEAPIETAQAPTPPRSPLPRRGDLGAPSTNPAADEDDPPGGNSVGSAPASSGLVAVNVDDDGATNDGGGPVVSNLGWRVYVPETPPAWEFKKNWNLRMSLPSHQRSIVWADEGRPYVAFQSSSNKVPWEVWDIAGVKRVAAWKGDVYLADEGALSPSGAKIAAAPGGHHRGFGMEGTFYVVDVAGGKVLNEFSGAEKMTPWHFLGEDWLIARAWPDKCVVYDLAQNQQAYVVDAKLSDKLGHFEVVPGGKYFIGVADDRIIAYETATGNRVGELRSSGFGWTEFGGLALSWDAKEMAVLYGKGGYVATFDVTTGEQTGDLKLDEAAEPPFGHSVNVKPIQWLPAREGFLLKGYSVVDRESGAPVWVIPSGGGWHTSLGPWLVPSYHVVGPADGDAGLISVPLPQDKIAAAAAAVRAGGEATDAALPPISKPKIDGVETFEIASIADRWSLAPDPAGGRRMMQQTLSLKSALGDVRNVAFSAPAGGTMVLGCGPQWHDRNQMGPHWLDRYDVAGGRSSGRFDLPIPGDLLAVSIDGSRVAVSYGRTRDRVDVYTIGDRKHVVGFRPYSRPTGAEENKHAPRQSPESLRWARFLGNDRLLTLNHTPASLVLWKLPECQALYEMALSSTLPPAVTPGGKYVILPNGATLDFLEVETGKIVARLDAQARGRSLTTVPAVHESGLRMAAMAEDVLLVWNLETGELLGDLDVQATNVERVQWCGDKYVMLDDYLFDLQRACVVWTYRRHWTIPGFGSASLPDSRAWSFASDLGNKGAYLLAKSLPEPKLKEEIEKVMPADRKPLFGPGSRVKISSSFGGSAEEQKRLNDELPTLAARDGAVVSSEPDAFTLRLTNNVVKTDTTEYRRMGGFGPFGPGGPSTFSVTTTTMECEMALVDPQGKVIWSRKATVGGSPPPIIFGDTAQYSNSHWGQALNFFLGCKMPREVYEQPRKTLPNNQGEILGFGWSSWTPQGPIPQP